MGDKKFNKQKIFFICISLTLCLMIFKKINYREAYEKVINLRILFDKKTLNYVCEKAGNALSEKYSQNYNAKTYAKKRPNDAQKAIIDYSRNSKYYLIKKYFPRIALLFLFLVIDIIFIICWISYCCCSCCNCCCFKMASPPSYCSRLTFFLIAVICNIILIIFCIPVLALVVVFVRRFNGIACSTFTFMDHLREGLGNSYPKQLINRWDGIPALKNIVSDSNNKYKEINDMNQLHKDAFNAKSNYTALKTDTCGIKRVIKENDLDNDVNYLSKITDSSLGSINFDEQLNNIDDIDNELINTEKDACQDIYKFLRDYINKYVKKILCLFFIINIIVAFFAFIFLLAYYISKSNVFRIIYVVIWNISMLLMIISIVLSVIFGLLGYLLTDATVIVQYILSTDNLNHKDPIFIKSNSTYVSNFIDTCFNGDGEFLRVIQKNEELKNYTKAFNETVEKHKNTLNELSRLQCKQADEISTKNSIAIVYNSLVNKYEKLVNIGSSLTNISCTFAKNDKMIAIEQIDDAGNYGMCIFVLSFFVGILFAISILAGILFVHKCRYEDDVPQNPLGKGNSTTDINETTENIGKNQYN